jgi:hypothetical protein
LDHNKGSFERSLSLESLELGTEELCGMASVQTAMQGPAYLPARNQTIAMGKGAFTSYVRSRGEPDGHTNNSSDHPKGRELSFSNPNHAMLPPLLPTGRPPLPALRNPHGPPSAPSSNRTYQNIAVQRADSSSSGSSMTDWENGLTTVRRRAAPPIPLGNPPLPPSDPLLATLGSHSVSGFDSSDSEFILPSTFNPKKSTSRFMDKGTIGNPGLGGSAGPHSGKRVTWKMSDKISGADGNKPWMNVRNVFPVKEKDQDVTATLVGGSVGGGSIGGGGGGGGRSTNLHEHLIKSSPLGQISRDLPLSDVYHERNMGLGLAPSLSKLLLTNRLHLGSIEGPAGVNGSKTSSGNKSDTEGGNVSMDETMSTFDQLSLAEDSAAESSGGGGGGGSSINGNGISKPSRNHHSKLTTKALRGGIGSGSKVPKNGSGPFVTTAEISPISLNLVELGGNVNSGHHDGSSSASSSKSSPSDLSRRDEGDGRSLTDSQYGSYSPSMAQNDLIVQSAAAAVYYASRGGNGPSCEIQGAKQLLNSNTAAVLSKEDDLHHQAINSKSDLKVMSKVDLVHHTNEKDDKVNEMGGDNNNSKRKTLLRSYKQSPLPLSLASSLSHNQQKSSQC